MSAGAASRAYQDMASLPYCQATIYEVQRVGSIAHVTPPHDTKRDAKLAGYDIPKGTSIMVNMHYLMNSNEMSLDGSDPSTFNPGRFLDSHGQQRRDGLDAFIPFGVGKRVCVGETLAKPTLAIFFVELLQKFRFLPPADAKHPHYPDPEKWTLGITRICNDFAVRIESSQ